MKHLILFLMAILALGLSTITIADEQNTVVKTVGSFFAQLTTGNQAKPAVTTRQEQQKMTPQEALQRLKDGNKRFTSGQMQHRDLLSKTSLTAGSQFPFAVVLNCIDSRSPTELVFDQGIGDIFAIRIAGNIQNPDILGSMEFATKLSGARLIAVIGHTNCGAIRGACEDAKLGNLTQLLTKLQPAVEQAQKTLWNKNCTDNTFMDQAAKDNVLIVMKQIQQNSPVIKQLLADGQIGLVGGIHNLATGEVTFFDEYQVLPKSVA